MSERRKILKQALFNIFYEKKYFEQPLIQFKFVVKTNYV